MSLIKTTCSIFCLFFSLHLFAQDASSFNLEFIPTWEGESIQIPISLKKEKTQINVFRTYVSHFELWKNNKCVWKEENSFHLLDAEIATSLVLDFDIPKKIKYNRIKFQLGVDSTTSVSGAMGGDLDPTKGMFWAWNTGYINFKLEGINPICPSRKNKFQFHLGGYEAPYASIQEIEFKLKKKKDLKINICLDQFLNAINLKEQHSIMIPGEDAVKLSKLAAQLFKLAYE